MNVLVKLGDQIRTVLGEKGKLKGKPQPDPDLRDTENVSLTEDVRTYFKREVLPAPATPSAVGRSEPQLAD